MPRRHNTEHARLVAIARSSLAAVTLGLYVFLCAPSAGVGQVVEPRSITSALTNSRDKPDHWKTDDGLPDNTVDEILQTSDGYIWLGTQRGLARFDGARFTVFNTDNTPALRNNAISTLFEDREGTLWIGTGGGGISRLKAGRFSSLTTAEGLSSNYTRAICQDSSGAIWIGTAGGGLNRLVGGAIAHFTTASGLLDNSIRRLFVDQSGALWIGSVSGGLTQFVNGSMRHFSKVHGLPSDAVTALCQDRMGNLWIGTSSGIAYLKDGRFEVHARSKELPNAYVSSLTADDEGALWIGTKGGGLSRLLGQDLRTYSTVDGLNSNFVSALLQDREGNVWVGTGRGGLNMFRKARVSVFTTRDGLGNDYVSSVYESRDGTVWAGTNGGGLSLLRKGRISTISLKHVLSNDFIRTVCEPRSGGLWIGTWGGGIALHSQGRVSQPAFLRSFPGRHIRDIIEDRKGNIWVASNGQGVYKYADGRWTPLDTRNGLSNVFVSCIAEDSSGTIWIGTSGGGLNRLREDSVTILRKGKGLTSDFVTSLYADTDQALWVATNGGGLCRLRGGHTDSWGTSAGLVDNVIFAIVDDQEGNLWLTGPRGITRVSKRELSEHTGGSGGRMHIINFDESDGMRSSECSGGSQRSGQRTRDGKIWIPTVDGLVAIDLRSIRKETLKFPLYIEQIAIDKVARDITLPITADFGNGEIEVQYAALSFRNAKKLQFRYRLEGFETEWQVVGSRRTAFYTNVPPGQYVFHVEADAGTVEEAPQHASLAFDILPPFWMTWWFRSMLGLGLIGVIAGSVRYFSTQKLKRRLEKVEGQAALERERVRISKDMHDELGASLTKISLLSELAKRNTHKPEEILGHLDKVSIAARETANTMDELVWAVNPKNDSLDNLAAYLLQYIEEYISDSNLQCKIELPDDLPPRHVSAEVRHHIFLVVKEGLNNIVKHSGATSVHASLSYVDSSLAIKLQDNGRGFSQQSVGRFSDGLGNMRRRMESIGGAFTVDSKLKQGTTIEISVSM